MNSLDRRLRALEASTPKSNVVAFITYDETKTKAEAIAEWEAENGIPISRCLVRFFTTFEPMPEWAKKRRQNAGT